mgnify:CR=1 FL=1
MKVKLLLVLILFAWPLGAQEPEGLPRELKYRVVENFFQLPDSIWLAEAVGVAVRADGHIFALNRGNHPVISTRLLSRNDFRRLQERLNNDWKFLL